MNTPPNHAVQPTPCAVGFSDEGNAALAHAAADGERYVAQGRLMDSHKTIALLVLVALTGCSRASKPVPPSEVPVVHNLAVGQVWAYRARPADQGSTLTIGRLEELPTLGSVVHISLAGVHVRNPGVAGGYSNELPHAPFTRAAIDQSITELLRQAAPPAAFEQGYQQWQQSQGGAFTVSVAEAVDLLEKGLNK